MGCYARTGVSNNSHAHSNVHLRSWRYTDSCHSVFRGERTLLWEKMKSKRSFLTRSSFKTFVENQNYFNFWTNCLSSLLFISTYSLTLWVGNTTWTGSIKMGCGDWKLMKTSRAFCLSRNLAKRPTRAWEEESRWLLLFWGQPRPFR